MPQPAIRIVHVIASTNGAPWLLELMREQRSRGHHVSAIIPQGDGTITRALRDEAFAFATARLDLISAGGIVPAIGTVIELVRLFRRIRPDVVHYHLFQSIITGRLAAWAADVPLRFSMIPGTYYLETEILGAIETGTAWADTRVIATCEKTRELYRQAGCPDAKLEMIHYGVNPEVFDPARYDGSAFRREIGVAPDTPLIGLVAYFYPKGVASPFTPKHLADVGIKGHDIAIGAITEVLRRLPDAKLVFVGGPWGAGGVEYMEEMRALARESGVAENVIFSGTRPNVPEALAALDVALQCSRSENLGGTIEALLMQRPLVVTNVGGLVDSVKHRRTGLVVPPEDPSSLAEAILELIENRELANELARNGRQLMLERFTVAYLADSLEALYERCAREARLDPERPSGSRYRAGRSIARFALLPFRVAPLWLRIARAVPRVANPFRRLSRRLTSIPKRFVLSAAAAAPSLLRRLLRRKLDASGSRPLRVAQVVGTSVGCEWMVAIAKGLKENGYEVCAVIDTVEGTLPERLEAAGIRYFRVPMTFATGRDRLRLLHYAVRLPLSILKMARILRRERIDVVQSHIFTSMVMSRAASCLAGTPRHISMIPGPRHLEAGLTRIVDIVTGGLDDVTVAGCQYTSRIYRNMGVPPSRLRCIYYGGDAERFDPAKADGPQARAMLGIPADAKVVTLVAQFYPPMFGPQNPRSTRGVGIKGHEHFLAAAEIVLAKFPESFFLLVGSGHGEAGEAYRKRLEEQCERSVLRGRVVFTGFRNDVADLLAASDVAVQCSLTENLGGTIESLLMEVPTVATRIGGMPESVVDGRTGVTVPAADPSALADAITRLLSNREAALALATQGRRFMLQQFTMKKTVDDVAALISGIAGERRVAAVAQETVS